MLPPGFSRPLDRTGAETCIRTRTGQTSRSTRRSRSRWHGRPMIEDEDAKGLEAFLTNPIFGYSAL
jgi:hypothetical protein